MLGKLMKYELKATARTFVPLYIALILVSIFNRITSTGNFKIGLSISTLILVGLFIALGVLTFIVLVQRFKKNLLGDEGYLMFTLPVKSHQLITSKLIISFLWSVLSGVIALLVAYILAGSIDIVITLIHDINVGWSDVVEFFLKEHLIETLCLPVWIIAVYSAGVLTIYLALSIAQLPIFIKYRGIISFIAFFVEMVVIQLVSKAFFDILEPLNLYNNDTNIVVLTTVWLVIIAAGLFWSVNYILNKHLNLE